MSPLLTVYLVQTIQADRLRQVRRARPFHDSARLVRKREMTNPLAAATAP